MKLNRLLSAIAALVLAVLAAQAHTPDSTVAAAGSRPERPVLSAYTVSAGSSHVAETYLSPLKYSGWSTALAY